MEGGLFLTDEFKEFAKGKILFVSIMSHVEDRKNDNLLSVYGFRGFPSMAILSPKGGKISSTDRSVKGFSKAYKEASEKMKSDKEAVAKADKEYLSAVTKIEEEKKKAAIEKAAFDKLLNETKLKAKKGDKLAKKTVSYHKAYTKLVSSKSRKEADKNSKVLSDIAYGLMKEGYSHPFKAESLYYTYLACNESLAQKDKKTAKLALAQFDVEMKLAIKKEAAMKVRYESTYKALEKKVAGLE